MGVTDVGGGAIDVGVGIGGDGEGVGVRVRVGVTVCVSVSVAGASTTMGTCWDDTSLPPASLACTVTV